MTETALLIDTETTGIVEPSVVEYGQMLVMFDEAWSFGGLWSLRYKPTKPIEFGAMSVHGITEQDVADREPFVMSSFGHEYMIGQNVDFDWAAVGKPDCKRIDTLCLARKVWPDLDSHKLMALVAYLDVARFKEFFASAHSVETDILATAFVLQKLIEVLHPANMADLYQMSEEARIPTVMQFGKHKGMAIKDLPADYVRWYLGQAETDPYLVQAMRAR